MFNVRNKDVVVVVVVVVVVLHQQGRITELQKSRVS